MWEKFAARVMYWAHTGEASAGHAVDWAQLPGKAALQEGER